MTIVAIVKSWKGHSVFLLIFCYHIKIEIRIGKTAKPYFLRIYPNSDIKAVEKRLANIKYNKTHKWLYQHIAFIINIEEYSSEGGYQMSN